MENSNSNDTLPTPVSPAPQEEPQTQSTRPVPVAEPGSQAAAGFTTAGQTAPAPLPPPPVKKYVEPKTAPRRATPAAPAAPAAKAPANKPPKKKRVSWLLVSFLGLLALVMIAVLSALGGYFSGIGLRKGAESTQVSLAVDEQYKLSLQDIEQGEYFRARQRLEYVIQLNPSYPGAVDKLAAVLAELNTTATPTLAPTPTLTPTPDTRNVEDLFNQGQQYLASSDWTNTIDALLALRKADPNFHTVDVDGMLFVALRNRGAHKILNADLEGGIYDITLAQRFGLLDAEAQSYLNWSTLYITGASFWEIDWGQAAYYFGQVAPYAPNLSDGSGMTASQRYLKSLVQYASKLANQNKWCDAVTQLTIAVSISPDAETQRMLAEVSQNCGSVQTTPQAP